MLHATRRRRSLRSQQRGEARAGVLGRLCRTGTGRAAARSTLTSRPDQRCNGAAAAPQTTFEGRPRLLTGTSGVNTRLWVVGIFGDPRVRLHHRRGRNATAFDARPAADAGVIQRIELGASTSRFTAMVHRIDLSEVGQSRHAICPVWKHWGGVGPIVLLGG